MELETKINEFLEGRSQGLKNWLEELAEVTGEIWLFGGAVRDIALNGPDVSPRDLDIVLVDPLPDRLSNIVARNCIRRTSFGGWKLQVGPIKVDLWDLKDTWAFQEGLVDSSPEKLPQTTFLTTQAVAASIEGLKVAKFVEEGFEDSVKKGAVDVNLMENPLPALSIVRALCITKKLGFEMSKELSNRLEGMRKECSAVELKEVQEKHYGSRLLSVEEIDDMIEYWDNHYE